MRRVFRITWWILAVFACLYLGLIYYSRTATNRELIQDLEERKASQDRAVVDAYGGNSLSILSFYANPAAIHPGEKTQLCYSVPNAESVRIDPPVENVWPSLSRCVDVAPTSDTVFTLIAEDANGNTVTAETTVEVN
jgi:hypothetical protein